MFLPLELLLENSIEHSTIEPIYVKFAFSTRIFCRGVQGFSIVGLRIWFISRVEPIYVKFAFSTRIFCRGLQGFSIVGLRIWLISRVVSALKLRCWEFLECPMVPFRKPYTMCVRQTVLPWGYVGINWRRTHQKMIRHIGCGISVRTVQRLFISS